MKIIVLSDTHIPERAEALPKNLEEEIKLADMVIHAGDLTSLDFLEKLKKLSPNVKAVCGNMDQDEIKRKLPEKEILKIGKFKIAVTHGFGAPNKLIENLSSLFKDDNLDMIIFGHSHSPVNEKIGKTLFLNPGSPTDNVFARYLSYGVVEINGKIDAKIIKL
jgi:putative phosphoesterase